MNPWVWLLSLTLLLVASEAKDFWDYLGINRKVRVIIYNDLPVRTNINVDCKSKDDDLRPRVLPYHKSFYFEFHPEFWGGTLFTCKVQWNGKSHCFDAYNRGKYGDIHRRNVVWMVKPNGPCTIDVVNELELCYHWDTNDCHA